MIEEEYFPKLKKQPKSIQSFRKIPQQKPSESPSNHEGVITQNTNDTLHLQQSCQPRINTQQLIDQYDKSITKQESLKKQLQANLPPFQPIKKSLEIQKQRSKVLLIPKKSLKQKQNAWGHRKIVSRHKNLQDKQKSNSNQTSTSILSRTIKDRINPFLNIRADKFIEIEQQAKLSNQNLAKKIIKYFGVGLDYTPLGISLKKQQKNDVSVVKSMKKYQQKSKISFSKRFTQAFQKNKKIFAQTYQPRNRTHFTNIVFEDRLRKIIKYHGQFWNDQFTIN